MAYILTVRFLSLLDSLGLHVLVWQGGFTKRTIGSSICHVWLALMYDVCTWFGLLFTFEKCLSVRLSVCLCVGMIYTLLVDEEQLISIRTICEQCAYR